ncbi:MAG TPA: MmcQ/YjbR family DNA-binding protein [Dehalococcoidia bacterium]|nr:MmcQ/YjbR family DNA-binding protein [Dehalococcoidia bacterium]
MSESRFPPVALPDTPFAKELQTHCLSFDGAWEDYPWGDIVYKVGKKMFAAIGGSPVSVTIKATPDDASVLTQMPNIERARYVGQYGWVTVSVADEATLDMAQDLIAASYDLVAPKRRRRG